MGENCYPQFRKELTQILIKTNLAKLQKLPGAGLGRGGSFLATGLLLSPVSPKGPKEQRLSHHLPQEKENHHSMTQAGETHTSSLPSWKQEFNCMAITCRQQTKEQEDTECNQENLEQTPPTILPVHKSSQVETEVAPAMKYSMSLNSLKQVFDPTPALVMLQLGAKQLLKFKTRDERDEPGYGARVPLRSQQHDLSKLLRAELNCCLHRQQGQDMLRTLRGGWR